MAGRVLVRFWTAAQEAKSEEQIITLRAEVEYIACAGRLRLSSLGFHWPNPFSSAIGKFGERIPLASEYSSEMRLFHRADLRHAERYSRMLNEIATKTCGEKIFII